MVAGMRGNDWGYDVDAMVDCAEFVNDDEEQPSYGFPIITSAADREESDTEGGKETPLRMQPSADMCKSGAIHVFALRGESDFLHVFYGSVGICFCSEKSSLLNSVLVLVVNG